MRLKSAARFTLYSSLLMTAANVVFYLFFISFLSERAGSVLNDVSSVLLVAMLVLTAGTALVSYFISSLVVDRILNPVRSMITQVREAGDRHFTKRLVVDSAEDELVEYAHAFNEMAMKINDHIEKQRRFVSDASHELATPITIINGHADLLLRWGKDDPAQLSESLTVIKNEALHMNGLVEDLLFFARSDNNRQAYDFKQVDITALVQACADEQRMLHPQYQINCAGGSRAVRGDAGALRRVMRILLDNAVKYDTENRSITIHITDCGEEQVRVTVADRGPGVPPASIGRIFDRFYRADDSRDKRTGGTGLGLSIAKEIIERHGGVIRMENNNGAVFWFEI